MVVFPVPGPPVITTAFSDTAARTASTCFGASLKSRFRCRSSKALSASTFPRFLVEEIKRLVQALQLNAKAGLATPEGWHPGDKCIVPPPGTAKDADERMKSKYEVTDWYFSKTDCPKG